MEKTDIYNMRVIPLVKRITTMENGKEKTTIIDNLSRDEFEDGLKKYLMYYMWSKCEYEIILSPWTGRADDIKIDVYDQIMMNWNSFVDYVWSLKEIKKGAE